MVDPFATNTSTGIHIHHAVPAPAPAPSNGLDDLFGTGPGLVNLDNLNSAPKSNNNNMNRPSLGQLASQSGQSYPTRNVMGGSMNNNNNGVALGNLDFGLGMAGINVNNLGNNNNNNNFGGYAPAPAPKAEFNPFE